MPHPLHTLLPMHVMCTSFYMVPSWLKFIFFCTTFIAKKYSFSTKWTIYHIAIFVLFHISFFELYVHRKSTRRWKIENQFHKLSSYSVVTKDILRDLMQLKINRMLKCCRIKTNMMKPLELCQVSYIILKPSPENLVIL